MMYITVMLRINIYIPEELNKRLELISISQQKAKAAIIREALEKGLQSAQSSDHSAQALLEIARLAEQLPNDHNTPRDLSVNHDYYLWGGKKKDKDE